MAEGEPEPTQRLSWARHHWRPLAAVGLLLVLVYVIIAATVLPGWIVSLSARPKVDDSTLLKAVTDTRSALLGLLAPLAVVVGGVAALLNYRATTEQNRAVLELQRRGQVTERFSKAIEQLGESEEDKLDVRIGAIYALEQIAHDSPELHWPIMEVLTAHLRYYRRRHGFGSNEEATPTESSQTLPPEAQAIATVIGRRRQELDPDGQRLELSETDLPGVQWGRAHLQRANLYRANLAGAYLRLAHLEGARLVEADLSNARLERSVLGEAWLEGANLTSARLGNTDLSGVHGLTWEQLQVVNDLTGASLPSDLASRLESITDPTTAPPERPAEPTSERSS